MKVLIALILLVTSNVTFGQKINYPKYNTDSICLILLKDTANNNEGVKAWLRSYADSIKSYGNNIKSFFPYQPFDKVMVFRLNQEYLTTRNTKNLSEERYTSKGYVLAVEDINELLEIINNPTYFSFSECGTAITQYEIQFLNGDSIVEKLRIDCGDRQLTTNSKEKDMNWQRMKYGALVNEKSIERLKNILIHSGAYYNAKY